MKADDLMIIVGLTIFISLEKFTAAHPPHHQQTLETLFQWKLLEYGFPNHHLEQQARANGDLVPQNGVPIDVAVHYNAHGQERIFTTIPRFSRGIPYTLATIDLSQREGPNGPKLKAYPSYEWHNSNNTECNGIISAFRVAINECNQMWVIDSGIIGSESICPPQLLLFDLNNDQLLHRYVFTSDLYTPGVSIFITPILRLQNPHGNCRKTMIYVPDTNQPGLVVYNFEQDRAWRVESVWMFPDPNYGIHKIAGGSFFLMDGIFGVSIDESNLYFHPLASVSEYAVPLSVLNNANNFVNGAKSQERQFRQLGTRRSECATEAIDSFSNLYCVTFNPITLLKWNTKSLDYSANTWQEISVDGNLLQFVSGMKVVRNRYGKEELWMISNRFQLIAAGTQQANEINFRIVKRSLEDQQLDFGIRNDLHDKLIFN